MIKSFFTSVSLMLIALFFGCSQDENRTQTTFESRPTAPITVGEVKIGDQIWMTKNLNVSRYRNGDPIPQVSDPIQWNNLRTGAWCYYNNDPANGVVYGKLYNWYAVHDPRGLGPLGWHIPSRTEWIALNNYLGENAGGKMKTTSGWQAPNDGATNSSGFSAIPGGYRLGFGPFDGLTQYGYWWSATEDDSQTATSCSTYYFGGNLAFGYNTKFSGFSVRCLKN